MKQIIERIIPDNKAALQAVGAVVLLLCVLAAVPFTAAAFGRGFQQAETQPAGVDPQTYADALAACSTLESESARKDADILALEEENRILREALVLSEEEAAALTEQLAQCEADREQSRAFLEQVLSRHSKKYLVKVTVTGEYAGGIIRLSWPDYFYATAEEFEQYQRGDILAGHPEVGHPASGSWTIVVEDKLTIELEGID